MPRLINADKIGLTDFEIVMCEGSYKNALEMLIDKITNAPTVDAVPVVRCKDCKHRFEGEKFPNCCDVLMEMSQWLVEIPVKDEWHCGSGERKKE